MKAYENKKRFSFSSISSCFLHCCPLILLVFSFRKSVSEVILITCLPYCCRWLEFLHFIFFSLTRTFMGKTHNAVFSFPSQDHCKPHEEGCPLSGAASPTVRTKPGTKELDQRLINEWTNGRYNYILNYFIFRGTEDCNHDLKAWTLLNRILKCPLLGCLWLACFPIYFTVIKKNKFTLIQ